MEEETSTQRFLRNLNAWNTAIAEQDAERKEEIERMTTSDSVREQRQEERREKYGQLRAREHASRRPRQVRSVLPHVDLSGPNN